MIAALPTCLSFKKDTTHKTILFRRWNTVVGPNSSSIASNYNPERDKGVNTIGSEMYYNIKPGITEAPMERLTFYDGSGNVVRSYPNWIVVTSIQEPTDDIKTLSRLPGWKLLVVGDTKTPRRWR